MAPHGTKQSTLPWGQRRAASNTDKDKPSASSNDESDKKKGPSAKKNSSDDPIPSMTNGPLEAAFLKAPLPPAEATATAPPPRSSTSVQGWNCPKCTFYHHAPGTRCVMCDALRTTRQQMHDFVLGKPVEEPILQEDGTMMMPSQTSVSERSERAGSQNSKNSNRPVSPYAHGPLAAKAAAGPTLGTASAPLVASRKRSSPGASLPQQGPEDGVQPTANRTIVNPYARKNSALKPPPQQQQQKQLHQSAPKTSNIYQMPAAPTTPAINSNHHTPFVTMQNQSTTRFESGNSFPSALSPQPQVGHQPPSLLTPVKPFFNPVQAATPSAPKTKTLEFLPTVPIPFEPGPVPMDEAAASHWIYPKNERYPARDYQTEITETALFNNTLVSLPTGLGKTLIAAVVMYNFYRWFPAGKVIFLAPTVPLVNQQVQACYDIMGVPKEDTAIMTGRASPVRRKGMWEEKRLFYCTPQTVQKDLESGACPDQSVVCVILDEAHRSSGNYAYIGVVQRLLASGAKFRIIGLSATPGKSIRAIQEVIDALHITKVEARSEADQSVQIYVHQRQYEVVVVSRCNLQRELERDMLEIVRPVLEKLKDAKALTDPKLASFATMTSYQLLQEQNKFLTEKANARAPREEYGPIMGNFYTARKLIALKDSIHQSVVLFRKKIHEMVEGEKNKSSYLAKIVWSTEFQRLVEKVDSNAPGADSVRDRTRNNPKLARLSEVLAEHFKRAQACGKDSRAIVFAQFRDTISEIESVLGQLRPLIRPRRFIGQSTGAAGANTKKTTNRRKNRSAVTEQDVEEALQLKGMKQSEQQDVIREFRGGVFNVLACTSIGEEGLDIGEVDLIVNYDNVNSPIRNIQRMGRTGRRRAGRVVCLVMEGDEEKQYYRSKQAEKTLVRALKNPSAFRVERNVPLIPGRPIRMDMEMAIASGFSMSQVDGGKGLKRKSRTSGKFTYPKGAWRLSPSKEAIRWQVMGPVTIPRVLFPSSSPSDIPPFGVDKSLRSIFLRGRNISCSRTKIKRGSLGKVSRLLRKFVENDDDNGPNVESLSISYARRAQRSDDDMHKLFPFRRVETTEEMFGPLESAQDLVDQRRAAVNASIAQPASLGPSAVTDTMSIIDRRQSDDAPPHTMQNEVVLGNNATPALSTPIGLATANLTHRGEAVGLESVMLDDQLTSSIQSHARKITVGATMTAGVFISAPEPSSGTPKSGEPKEDIIFRLPTPPDSSSSSSDEDENDHEEEEHTTRVVTKAQNQPGKNMTRPQTQGRQHDERFVHDEEVNDIVDDKNGRSQVDMLQELGGPLNDDRIIGGDVGDGDDFHITLPTQSSSSSSDENDSSSSSSDEGGTNRFDGVLDQLIEGNDGSLGVENETNARVSLEKDCMTQIHNDGGDSVPIKHIMICPQPNASPSLTQDSILSDDPPLKLMKRKGKKTQFLAAPTRSCSLAALDLSPAKVAQTDDYRAPVQQYEPDERLSPARTKSLEPLPGDSSSRLLLPTGFQGRQSPEASDFARRVYGDNAPLTSLKRMAAHGRSATSNDTADDLASDEDDSSDQPLISLKKRKRTVALQKAKQSRIGGESDDDSDTDDPPLINLISKQTKRHSPVPSPVNIDLGRTVVKNCSDNAYLEPGTRELIEAPAKSIEEQSGNKSSGNGSLKKNEMAHILESEQGHSLRPLLKKDSPQKFDGLLLAPFVKASAVPMTYTQDQQTGQNNCGNLPDLGPGPADGATTNSLPMAILASTDDTASFAAPLRAHEHDAGQKVHSTPQKCSLAPSDVFLSCEAIIQAKAGFPTGMPNGQDDGQQSPAHSRPSLPALFQMPTAKEGKASPSSPILTDTPPITTRKVTSSPNRRVEISPPPRTPVGKHVSPSSQVLIDTPLGESTQKQFAVETCSINDTPTSLNNDIVFEAGAIGEYDIRCAVCLSGDSPPDDPIILCDGRCNQGFHQSCYSVSVDLNSDEEWRCDPCNSLYCGDVLPGTRMECSICLKMDGPLKLKTKGKWVHPQCSQWESDDEFKMCCYCSCGKAATCGCCDISAHPYCAMTRAIKGRWTFAYVGKSDATTGQRWVFCPVHEDKADAFIANNTSKRVKIMPYRPPVRIAALKTLRRLTKKREKAYKSKTAPKEDLPCLESPDEFDRLQSNPGLRRKRRFEVMHRSCFIDFEAMVGSDGGSDGEEDDEIAQQENDEEFHKNFINDSVELTLATQDTLAVVDPDIDLHGNAIHRALDNKHHNETRFLTPILNRRMRLLDEHHDPWRDTPSSTASPDKQLGKMPFIRSILEHQRKGGDAEDVEEFFRRLERGEDDDTIQSTQSYSRQSSSVCSPARPHAALAQNPKSSELSTEQRQRMELNRIEALKRRQEFLKKQHEK